MSSMNSKCLKTYKIILILVALFFLSLNLKAKGETGTELKELNGAMSGFNSNVKDATSATKSIKDAYKATDASEKKDDKAQSEEELTPPTDNLNQNDNAIQPPGFFDRFFGKIITVHTNIDNDANNNSAILCELVVIYDQSLYKTVSNITLKQWYRSDNQGINAIKNSKDIQIFRFELTPDVKERNFLVKIRSHAVEALLFNRIENNLNHFPLRIAPYQNIYLSFYSLGFDFKQF